MLSKQNKNKIVNLLKSISCEKKIVIIAGGGIRVSNTAKKFIKFLKKNNLPFVTSWPSQDITKFNEKLYFGSVGRHGNESANEIIKSADLVITFGFRFGPKAINENFGKDRKIKIISVDIDKYELTDSNVKISEKINADLRDFFKISEKIKIKKYDNKIG